LSRRDHNQHDAELERLRAKVAELESGKKDKKKDQFRDIVLTLAFTAGPFGFGVSIFYSCISWAVAWVAFVHLIWNLEYLSGVRNRTKSLGALITSAALVLVSYSPIRTAYIKEKARATTGDLVAKSDGKDHSSDPPAIQMGPNGTVLAWTGPSNVAPITAYYDKIDVKMVNGRVRLSTTVHDDNKNLIAEVIDNHWTVSSSTAVCWDKNYSDDSLEVKDGHGRIVLQVKLFPSVVQIQEEWQWDPGTKSGGIIQTGKYDEKNGIKRVFKYPSELYWGQSEPGPY
jgi:hypothetical protein